jgi:hypothetical protein
VSKTTDALRSVMGASQNGNYRGNRVLINGTAEGARLATMYLYRDYA